MRSCPASRGPFDFEVLPSEELPGWVRLLFSVILSSCRLRHLLTAPSNSFDCSAFRWVALQTKELNRAIPDPVQRNLDAVWEMKTAAEPGEKSRLNPGRKLWSGQGLSLV